MSRPQIALLGLPVARSHGARINETRLCIRSPVTKRLQRAGAGMF
jgi:hypothetical protein